MYRTPRSERPRRARILWVGLAFLGILLMHGLTGHGSPAAADEAMVPQHEHSTVASTDHGDAVAGASAPAATALLGEHGHSGHLMVMSLCLAVLVAVAMLIAPLRGGSLHRSRTPGSVLAPHNRGRLLPLPRPPDLTLLQVCRC